MFLTWSAFDFVYKLADGNAGKFKLLGYLAALLQGLCGSRHLCKSVLQHQPGATQKFNLNSAVWCARFLILSKFIAHWLVLFILDKGSGWILTVAVPGMHWEGWRVHKVQKPIRRDVERRSESPERTKQDGWSCCRHHRSNRTKRDCWHLWDWSFRWVGCGCIARWESPSRSDNHFSGREITTQRGEHFNRVVLDPKPLLLRVLREILQAQQ